MTRSQWVILLFSTLSAAASAVGCESGGVGDPCIPEDEYTPTFSGFGVTEANVESRSFQCVTRVCIANHFQGRVTCPYGQTKATADAYKDVASVDPASVADPGACFVPMSSNRTIKVAVEPQLKSRRAEDTVYCSCRCEGPDKTAAYCDCPSGYSCQTLVPDLGLGQAQLVGKYCIKNGTEYKGSSTDQVTCGALQGDCPSDREPNASRNPPP